MIRAQIRVPAAGLGDDPGHKHGVAEALSSFRPDRPSELKQARDEAIAAGATSLVLDLRGNPGGYVDQAVDAASLFIPEGTVYVRELASGERIPVPTNPTDRGDRSAARRTDRQQHGASSAEILAGALGLPPAALSPRRDDVRYGHGAVALRTARRLGRCRLAVERWLTPDEGAHLRPWHPARRGDYTAGRWRADRARRAARPRSGRALPSITDSQLLRALGEILVAGQLSWGGRSVNGSVRPGRRLRHPRSRGKLASNGQIVGAAHQTQLEGVEPALTRTERVVHIVRLR